MHVFGSFLQLFGFWGLERAWQKEQSNSIIPEPTQCTFQIIPDAPQMALKLFELSFTILRRLIINSYSGSYVSGL
jgi:hypothetical protein